MKKILLVIIISFLAVSASYSQDQPLQLTIKADKQMYAVGEKINIRAQLQNISKETVPIYAFKLIYRIHLDIRNSSGIDSGIIVAEYEMPDDYRHVPQKQDFYFLKPQETYSIDIENLVSGNTRYEIIRPGVYTIEAILRLVVRGEQFGINAWTGTLTSNSITITAAEKELATLIKECDTLNSFMVPPKGTPRKAVEEVYGKPDMQPNPKYGIYRLNDKSHQLDVQYDDNNLVIWADIPIHATAPTSHEMRIDQLKFSIRILSAIYTDYLDKLKKASWNEGRAHIVIEKE